jgi:hypothetical protein
MTEINGVVIHPDGGVEPVPPGHVATAKAHVRAKELAHNPGEHPDRAEILQRYEDPAGTGFHPSFEGDGPDGLDGPDDDGEGLSAEVREELTELLQLLRWWLRQRGQAPRGNGR